MDLQLDSSDFGDFGETENMGFEKKKCSVSVSSFTVDFLKNFAKFSEFNLRIMKFQKKNR